jgi:hypothetical protein
MLMLKPKVAVIVVWVIALLFPATGSAQQARDAASRALDWIDPSLGGLDAAAGESFFRRATDCGVAPIPLFDGGGKRLSLEAVLALIEAQPDAVDAVSALLDYTRSDLDYIPYDMPATLDELLHLRFSPRETLERGGSECSDIHALGAWLLREATGLSPDDVCVVQTFGVGGMHNVIVYRDPATGGWNVMNYGRVYPVDAGSAREAIEAVYGHPGRYEVYRPDGPDDADYAVHHLDRDTFTGRLQGLEFLPGLSGLDGVFGSVPCLNGVDPAGLYGRSLDMGERGLSWQRDGFDARLRLRADGGFDAAGVSFLTRPADDDSWIAGGKIAAPDQESVFGIFEFGRLSPDRWHWTAVGFGYREAGSIMTGGNDLPEIVPFLAHQQGARCRLIGDRISPGFKLSVDWNTHAAAGLPVCLTEDGVKIIESGSNGNFTAIDPNLISWAAIGADAATAARWRFSKEASIGVTVRYRGELNDPTLAPLLSALEIGADFQYRAGRAAFGVEALVTPWGGVWAHDSRWRIGLTGGIELASGLSVSGAAAVGRYIDDTYFVVSRASLNFSFPRGLQVSLRDELFMVDGESTNAGAVSVILRF